MKHFSNIWLTVLMILLLSHTALAGSIDTISIGGDTEGTTDTDIYINATGVDDVRALIFDILFDNNIIAVGNIAIGELADNTFDIRSIDNSRGEATIGVFATIPISGDGTIAKIHFDVVGHGKSLLNISDIVAIDSLNRKVAIGNIANSEFTAISIEPVISDFDVIPNTAISDDNPAYAIANIANGIGNVAEANFGIIDNNNLVSDDSPILSMTVNMTGIEGPYISAPWNGNVAYATDGTTEVLVTPIYVMSNMAIGNMAIGNIANDYTSLGNIAVAGLFKKNAQEEEKPVFLWLTGNLGIYDIGNVAIGNIATISDISYVDSGERITIEDGISTIKFGVFTYGNIAVDDPYNIGNMAIDKLWNIQYSVQNLAIYDILGPNSSNNPYIATSNAPSGYYKAFVSAKDAEDNGVSLFTDIDTIQQITILPIGGGEI